MKSANRIKQILQKKSVSSSYYYKVEYFDGGVYSSIAAAADW